MDFIKLKFHKAVIRPATQYGGEHLDIVCEEKKKVSEGILCVYPSLSIFKDYKVVEDKAGAFVVITLPLTKQKAKAKDTSIDVKSDNLPF